MAIGTFGERQAAGDFDELGHGDLRLGAERVVGERDVAPFHPADAPVQPALIQLAT